MIIPQPFNPPVLWHLREIPVKSKFSSEITAKCNILIGNQTIVNTYLVNLLQGASGGTQQANLPMATQYAPTGWSRNTSIQNDTILVVTLGAGLASGGDWAISGVTLSSELDHTHTTQSHTHDISHTHIASTHSHIMTHTHTFDHTHNMNNESVETEFTAPTGFDHLGVTSAAWSESVFINTTTQGHKHTYVHGHTLVTKAPIVESQSTSYTALGADAYTTFTGNSSITSNDTTDLSGAHTHGMTSDSSWRPSYMNIIACRKD
jgi:hypothetical protein